MRSLGFVEVLNYLPFGKKRARFRIGTISTAHRMYDTRECILNEQWHYTTISHDHVVEAADADTVDLKRLPPRHRMSDEGHSQTTQRTYG